MQPQLTLKDGQVIPLSDEVYELVLSIVRAHEAPAGAASSIEALEAEFADLFIGDAPSTADLLEEHRQELEREERKPLRPC
jgi:hypothetical protein